MDSRSPNEQREFQDARDVQGPSNQFVNGKLDEELVGVENPTKDGLDLGWGTFGKEFGCLHEAATGYGLVGGASMRAAGKKYGEGDSVWLTLPS
jgi:hypothetical protein